MRDFSHLNTGKFSGLRIWGMVILFSMVVGGGFAFFLFYFSVNSIVIHKEKDDLNIQNGKMLQMLELVKGENLFILSNEFLEKQIQIRFPELEYVDVQKKYPSTIEVSAKTSPLVLKLVYSVKGEEDQFFGFIGEKGRFFENGSDDIFTVYDQDERDSFIMHLDPIFTPEEVSEMLEGKKMLESVTKRKIVSAKVLRDAQEIHFVDEQKVDYWFFLGKSFDQQVEKLGRTLQEKNIYEFPLLYIDLRIGRKVIYKNK